jgi:hypothetical protein
VFLPLVHLATCLLGRAAWVPVQAAGSLQPNALSGVLHFRLQSVQVQLRSVHHGLRSCIAWGWYAVGWCCHGPGRR